ncbi:uncharacterized protein LOC107761084 isoform X2 [Nicotiana tabacum]|uniref:Proline-rich receptor-like protein kinase PERK8 isoform X2 n=1 Tax=Nicotiana tabacum TaxID=4097 RepID=A0A1S3X4I6_TOBAC|nr:PREDICTED: proline-rich receptor-like protein kinase PERK8 isoform X2 [Nicotiana tabacum]
MALSTQPPPLDPPSTTTTTTITTSTIRPIIPNPIRPPTPQPKLHPFSLQSSHYPPTQNQPPQRLPPLSNPNYSQLVPKPPNNPDPPHHLQGFLYPVASSGRGFLPKPSSSNYPNRPVVGSRPPFGLNHMDPGSVPTAGAGVRPTHLQHSLVGSSPTANSAVINGFPVVTSSSHPKVRISDNASLYALSRSWLRNGLPDETQPQYMDGVRSLPRPLPLAPQDAESPVKKEGDKEEEKEDGGSVEHLSPKELLQRHVKRAKRIRSRLREERLRRIARYKTRLALLLPPMVEQQYKNDLALGN